MRQAHIIDGTFRLEETPDKALTLSLESTRIGWRNLTYLHLDKERRVLTARSRGPLPLMKRELSIPAQGILDITLTVYPIRAADEPLPLRLLVRYQEQSEAKGIELRGFIKGVDHLYEAKDFLYRLANYVGIKRGGDEIFRESEALALGFYSEQILTKTSTPGPEPINVQLQLHRDDREGAIPINQIERNADEAQSKVAFLRVPPEPLPTYAGVFTESFSLWKTSTYPNRLIIAFLSSILIPILLVGRIFERIGYNAKQVNKSFAFWRFLRSVVGFGILGFTLLFLRSYDNITRMIAFNAPLVVGSFSFFVLLHLLQRRALLRQWPSRLPDQQQRKGRALVYVIMLLSGLSAVTVLPPVRFQLMVWELNGGSRSYFLSLDDLMRGPDGKIDGATALALLTAPGVVEHQSKLIVLSSYQLAYKGCAKLGYLYAALRLRGVTDEEIMARQDGRKLFLGMLCDELSPIAPEYARSLRSLNYASWPDDALTLKPEGPLQIGLLSWELTQKNIRHLLQRTLNSDEQALVLKLALQTSGLLRAEDFTKLLPQHIAGLSSKEDRALLEQVMNTRREVMALLEDIPVGSVLGVAFSESIGGSAREEAIYAFLRSCGYSPQPGTELEVLVTSELVSYPELRILYGVSYQEPKYRTVTSGVGGKYMSTRRVQDGYTTRTRPTEGKVPLTVNTAVLVFRRGTKTIRASVAPFGVIYTESKVAPSAVVPEEQMLGAWRYGF